MAAVCIPTLGISVLSRCYESLRLVDVSWITWVGLILVWAGSIPVLLVIHRKRSRRGRAFSLIAGGAAGLAISGPLIYAIGFSHFGALQQAIRQAQPIVDALKKYQHTHGRVPETLDELVPEYLCSIPEVSLRWKKPYMRYTPGVQWELRFGGYLAIGHQAAYGIIEYRSDQQYGLHLHFGGGHYNVSGIMNGWKWDIRY